MELYGYIMSLECSVQSPLSPCQDPNRLHQLLQDNQYRYVWSYREMAMFYLLLDASRSFSGQSRINIIQFYDVLHTIRVIVCL